MVLMTGGEKAVKPIQANERFTLSKIISEELRDYIINNKLTTGDRLPSERELAAQMEVSRVIIREALRTLEATGLITIRQGEGAFVNSDNPQLLFQHLFYFWKINGKKANELLELRMLLEKAAIEQLCQHPFPEKWMELESSISKMKEANDPEIIKQLDASFHTGLMEATQNSLFIQLADTIVQYFSELPAVSFTEEEKHITIQEHSLILQALKECKTSEAIKILETHLHRPK